MQLIISQGPPLFDVPDVSGKTRDEATRALNDAGFKWSYTSGTGLPDSVWDLFANENTKVESYSPTDAQRKGYDHHPHDELLRLRPDARRGAGIAFRPPLRLQRQRFSSSSATRNASSSDCMWFRRGSHRLS